MKRLKCPGALAIPSGFHNDFTEAYCDGCGRILPVRNDGTVQGHPMDYEAFLREMANVVTNAAEWGFGSSIRPPRRQR